MKDCFKKSFIFFLFFFNYSTEIEERVCLSYYKNFRLNLYRMPVSKKNYIVIIANMV